MFGLKHPEESDDKCMFNILLILCTIIYTFQKINSFFLSFVRLSWQFLCLKQELMDTDIFAINRHRVVNQILLWQNNWKSHVDALFSDIILCVKELMDSQWVYDDAIMDDYVCMDKFNITNYGCFFVGRWIQRWCPNYHRTTLFQRGVCQWWFIQRVRKILCTVCILTR